MCAQRSDLRHVFAPLVCAAAFVLLYWNVLVKLARDWVTDDNYSHGFFIVPIALYFAYERRHLFSSATPHPTVLGLPILAASLGLLVAGTLGAELFLTRVSMIGAVVGLVLYLGGWAYARILAFPISFLLLMIPLPSIIFNQIAFPLQIVASRFGEATLRIADIPVLREGNVIILANTTLEVAEACSGIRSLVSLLTLGIVLGYFSDRRTWFRVAVALVTIPVAIVTNGLRVAGTGIAAHHYGPEAATGFFHTFSGWLVFVVAFSLLFAIQQGLLAVARPGHPSATAAAS